MHRPPPRLDLVWTGPETKASVARSTALVVEELFASAKECVIVGGYTFDRAEILAPLHRAMSERGVSTWMFVDIDGSTEDPSQADTFASAFIDSWFRRVEPTDAIHVHRLARMRADSFGAWHDPP